MSTADHGTTVKVLPIPTWLTVMSNGQLMAHYGASLNAKGPDDDPHLERRLKMLDDEIRRRCSIGQMVDNDLKV
jgi:hypothetical protein